MDNNMNVGRRVNRRSSVRRAIERRRGGFTLVEVLLVMAILLVLAAIMIPNLMGMQKTANIRNSRLAVYKFEGEFQKYNTMYNSYPTTEQGFSALISPPNPVSDVVWSAPIKSVEEAKDAYGKPLNYAFPGTHNGDAKPDIWSNGADGISNTNDDIGNW